MRDGLCKTGIRGIEILSDYSQSFKLDITRYTQYKFGTLAIISDQLVLRASNFTESCDLVKGLAHEIKFCTHIMIYAVSISLVLL